MGCFQSTGSGEYEKAKSSSDTLDSKIRGDKVYLENLITVLLLGAGDTGKSTIMKQMKIIHNQGFSQDERLGYKEIIFDNLVIIAKSLLRGAESLELKLLETNKKWAQEILAFDQDEDSTTNPFHILEIIKLLWKDPGIQFAYVQNNHFQLIDSAEYYLNSIDRIMELGYIPTEKDVLHSRVTTTGITETSFNYQNLSFRMIDVGGQRNERKKWIHCFENVNAVFFLCGFI